VRFLQSTESTLLKGQIASSIISLLSTVIVTRALGAEGRGLVAAALWLPNLLILVVSCGLDQATTRAYARSATESSKIFSNHALAVLIRSTALLSFGIPLITILHRNLLDTESKRLLFLGLAVGTSMMIFGSIAPLFLGRSQYVHYALILNLPNVLSLFFLTFAQFFIRLTPTIALTCDFVCYATSSMAAYVLFGERIRRQQLSMAYEVESLKYGLPIGLSSVSAYLVSRATWFFIAVIMELQLWVFIRSHSL